MGIQHKIIEYVISEYGMEKHPCCIPKNKFEDIKIDFYLWIRRNISEKLFYFIRDNICSIKYLDENPNGAIPIIYRDKITNKILVEFFVEQKKDFHFRDSTNSKEIGEMSGNLVLNTYVDDSILCVEIVNEEKYKEIIDYFLSRIDILAPIVRDKMINNVLN